MLSLTENKNRNGSLTIDKMFIFIFQPNQDFHSLSFSDKLNILKEKIVAAKEYLKKNPIDGLTKSLFIAPEYLSKIF